jgi:hypothetical protein
VAGSPDRKNSLNGNARQRKQLLLALWRKLKPSGHGCAHTAGGHQFRSSIISYRKATLMDRDPLIRGYPRAYRSERVIMAAIAPNVHRVEHFEQLGRSEPLRSLASSSHFTLRYLSSEQRR